MVSLRSLLCSLAFALALGLGTSKALAHENVPSQLPTKVVDAFAYLNLTPTATRSEVMEAWEAQRSKARAELHIDKHDQASYAQHEDKAAGVVQVILDYHASKQAFPESVRKAADYLGVWADAPIEHVARARLNIAAASMSTNMGEDARRAQSKSLDSALEAIVRYREEAIQRAYEEQVASPSSAKHEAPRASAPAPPRSSTKPGAPLGAEPQALVPYRPSVHDGTQEKTLEAIEKTLGLDYLEKVVALRAVLLDPNALPYRAAWKAMPGNPPPPVHAERQVREVVTRRRLNLPPGASLEERIRMVKRLEAARGAAHREAVYSVRLGRARDEIAQRFVGIVHRGISSQHRL